MGTNIPKKARIKINLLAEASVLSAGQIKERIIEEAKIPWCKNIEEDAIEDVEPSYQKLKKQGISDSVARNIMDFYTE